MARSKETQEIVKAATRGGYRRSHRAIRELAAEADALRVENDSLRRGQEVLVEPRRDWSDRCCEMSKRIDRMTEENKQLRAAKSPAYRSAAGKLSAKACAFLDAAENHTITGWIDDQPNQGRANPTRLAAIRANHIGSVGRELGALIASMGDELKVARDGEGIRSRNARIKELEEEIGALHAKLAKANDKIRYAQHLNIIRLLNPATHPAVRYYAPGTAREVSLLQEIDRLNTRVGQLRSLLAEINTVVKQGIE